MNIAHQYVDSSICKSTGTLFPWNIASSRSRFRDAFFFLFLFSLSLFTRDYARADREDLVTFLFHFFFLFYRKGREELSLP